MDSTCGQNQAITGSTSWQDWYLLLQVQNLRHVFPLSSVFYMTANTVDQYSLDSEFVGIREVLFISSYLQKSFPVVLPSRTFFFPSDLTT